MQSVVNMARHLRTCRLVWDPGGGSRALDEGGWLWMDEWIFKFLHKVNGFVILIYSYLKPISPIKFDYIEKKKRNKVKQPFIRANYR